MNHHHSLPQLVCRRRLHLFVVFVLWILCTTLILAGCSSPEQPTPLVAPASVPTARSEPEQNNEATSATDGQVAALPTAEKPITPTKEPPTPTPHPTATPSPMPTATLVSFDLSKSTSVLGAPGQPLPSFVKQQLAFASGGAYYEDWDPDTVGEIDASVPAIIEGATYLRERTYPPVEPEAPDVYVCGYADGAVLTVDLVNPIGQVQFSTEVTATLAAGGQASGRGACAALDQISQYEMIPSDPLGQYTIRIGNSGNVLEHKFELKAPDSPVFYYSERLNSYVLAGFKPQEEALVLVYVPTDQGDGMGSQIGVLAHWGEIIADQNGMASFTLPSELASATTVALYVVTSSGGDFAVVNRSTIYLGPRVWIPPLDYDQLIASDPDNPAWYYLRAKGTDYFEFDKKIADLTRAIELDPSRPEYYLERARTYEMADDRERAIADYQQVLSVPGVKPDLRAKAEAGLSRLKP